MASKGQKFRKYDSKAKEQILNEYHNGASSRFLGKNTTSLIQQSTHGFTIFVMVRLEILKADQKQTI